MGAPLRLDKQNIGWRWEMSTMGERLVIESCEDGLNLGVDELCILRGCVAVKKHGAHDQQGSNGKLNSQMEVK